MDRIVLPQTVYHSAWEDDGRARFTAAHEIGHWALHSTCALTRAHADTLKPFQNSEWQANLFAAEILMPVKFVYADDTAQDLCTRFRVSLQAAELRLRNLAKWGIALKRKPPRLGGGSRFVTG
ncbi:ImmA/IrrE family metallo-endopeptidase [Brevundimonas sp. UBA7534]|uniref:ImmA/IrrE family metallo-endopeptidase n=1 Tax=Brevundimonas sp. UBA7534 TaxID=1946138 RepID=UPI0039C88E37